MKAPIRFIFVVIWLLFLSFLSAAQEITELTLTIKEHDEPPTSKGRDTFTLTLRQDKGGNLLGSHFRRGKKEFNLRQEVVVSSGICRQVEGWLNSGKSLFRISDFDEDESALRSRQSDPGSGLGFKLPSDIVIATDSFEYCQPHLMRRVVSTGGVMVSVSLKMNGKEETFRFDSSSDRDGDFDLKGYLLCYRLLGGMLPKEFSGSQYFTSQKFIETVLHYYKVIECEGYYYDEYKRNHPELSPGELRRSWNLRD